MHGDGYGCGDGIDKFNYPRLSWSLPAASNSTWCSTVGIPSYVMWKNSLERSTLWDTNFALYSKKYPWTSKINKAVWRGSTTYLPNFKELDLKDTPRGKLVRLSMTNASLIDAAFVRLIKQYKGQEDALANETILAGEMPFDDQMKYKAIIDIDGNNWSSRFPKLLCTNSIVIKVEPDYIEYFYDELKPNQHYVSASLSNLTEVVAYVLDKRNQDEMREIVKSANLWCKRKMTKKQLAADMVRISLQKYQGRLDAYMDAHNFDLDVIESTIQEADDLVTCY